MAAAKNLETHKIALLLSILVLSTRFISQRVGWTVNVRLLTKIIRLVRFDAVFDIYFSLQTWHWLVSFFGCYSFVFMDRPTGAGQHNGWKKNQRKRILKLNVEWRFVLRQMKRNFANLFNFRTMLSLWSTRYSYMDMKNTRDRSSVWRLWTIKFSLYHKTFNFVRQTHFVRTQKIKLFAVLSYMFFF